MGSGNLIARWTSWCGSLLQRGVRSIRADLVFRRLLGNSGWVLGGNVLVTLFGSVQGIVVARMLGVEQFGVLSVVITFVSVVNQFTSFRMDEFVVKYVTEALAERRNDRAAALIKAAMIVEAGTSVITFGIILLLVPIGTRWFVRVPGTEEFITVYAVVVLGNLATQTTFGLLQVFNQFRLNSILASVGKAVALLLVILAYFWQTGMMGILLAYLAGNILSALSLLFAMVRETNRQLGKGWWRAPLALLGDTWRTMVKFVLSTNGSATLGIVIRDGDLLWLGYFRNSTEVGYYKLASSLAALIMMPVAPLSQTIYPEIARAVALQQWRQLRALLRKSVWLIAAYVLPAALVLGVSSPWLIAFFYGHQFTPAATALMILLIGLTVGQIFSWPRRALLALGRPDYPLKAAVLLMLLKLAGVFLLLPTYGYIGNAALMTGLYLISAYMLARKVYSEIYQHERLS